MVAAGLQCASLLSAAAECHVLLSSRKLPLEVCTARTCAIHQLNSAIAIRDEWMRRTFLEGTQCAAFCTGAAANMKQNNIYRLKTINQCLGEASQTLLMLMIVLLLDLK